MPTILMLNLPAGRPRSQHRSLLNAIARECLGSTGPSALFISFKANSITISGVDGRRKRCLITPTTVEHWGATLWASLECRARKPFLQQPGSAENNT